MLLYVSSSFGLSSDSTEILQDHLLGEPNQIILQQ